MENNNIVVENENTKSQSKFLTRVANLEKAKKDFEKRLAELERRFSILIKSLRR